MATTPFDIDLDAVGHGTVRIDGTDITTEVAGLELFAAPGQATRLVLHAHRPGKLTGEGIVEVSADTITAASVRELDPSMVSKLVAERAQWGVDDAVAYLEVIADLIDIGGGPP